MQNDIPKDANIIPQFQSARISLEGTLGMESHSLSDMPHVPRNHSHSFSYGDQSIDPPHIFGLGGIPINDYHPRISHPNHPPPEQSYYVEPNYTTPLSDDTFFSSTSMYNAEVGSLQLYETLFDAGENNDVEQLSSTNVTAEDIDVWMNLWMNPSSANRNYSSIHDGTFSSDAASMVDYTVDSFRQSTTSTGGTYVILLFEASLLIFLNRIWFHDISRIRANQLKIMYHD
jgi:hypothetical protein